jgi:hypothetical protein
MTDQYRATPEQWELIDDASREVVSASCILELRARIESLEAAQRLRQHAKLKPAWRPLDIETTYGSEAAADAAQVLRAPMVVEGTFDHGGKTYRFKANATPERDPAMPKLRARIEALEAAPQDKLDRLIALDAADPTHDPAMDELRAASAEAQPGGLAERVAAQIKYGINAELDPEGIARAAIREVATWLDRFALHGSGEYAQAAKVLRQEVGRG